MARTRAPAFLSPLGLVSLEGSREEGSPGAPAPPPPPPAPSGWSPGPEPPTLLSVSPQRALGRGGGVAHRCCS